MPLTLETCCAHLDRPFGNPTVYISFRQQTARMLGTQKGLDGATLFKLARVIARTIHRKCRSSTFSTIEHVVKPVVVVLPVATENRYNESFVLYVMYVALCTFTLRMFINVWVPLSLTFGRPVSICPPGVQSPLCRGIFWPLD